MSRHLLQKDRNVANLLTTKDLQALIHVDKSTIYRMAEDGRLPAIKIGRQWRFPADRIAEWLGEDIVVDRDGDSAASAKGPATAAAAPTTSTLQQLLPAEPAQAIADLVADLFGVMAVVTDMEGRPITTVANPCGFFATVHEQPGAVEHCVEGWRLLGAEIDLEPKFIPSHLGFLCARTFIRVGSELVGMLIVGGVTPKEWPPTPTALAAVADQLEIDPEILMSHVDETYFLDEAHQHWVLGLLPRLGDLISRLATTRSQLLSRLDAIAALAGPGSPSQRSTP